MQLDGQASAEPCQRAVLHGILREAASDSEPDGYQAPKPSVRSFYADPAQVRRQPGCDRRLQACDCMLPTTAAPSQMLLWRVTDDT